MARDIIHNAVKQALVLGVRSFFRAKTEFRQSNCLIMVKWTVKFTDLG